jgi:hypothetical protein
MGHAFERIAEQTYARLQPPYDLPVVREWSRWEGRDRDAKPLEIDIAATLTDGRVLTGAVKWNTKPLEPHWHLHHQEAIDRLASSGIKWAHEAKHPASPLLYVAAGGFTTEFVSLVRASRRDVHLWTLSDIFKPAQRKARNTGGT